MRTCFDLLSLTTMNEYNVRPKGNAIVIILGFYRCSIRQSVTNLHNTVHEKRWNEQYRLHRWFRPSGMDELC